VPVTMMPSLSERILFERAPAKINLALEILRRRPDGWHELRSIVAFASVEDHVSLTPNRALGLTVSVSSDALNETDDNLVMKAARALQSCIPSLQVGHFHLVKQLPIAAGIGGGSSDAAAALRLLAKLNGLSVGDERLVEAATQIGADVPVCLNPRLQLMEGLGERVRPLYGWPRFFAVLVNPGLPLETARVFNELGLERGSSLDRISSPDDFKKLQFSDCLHWLQNSRNDLENPAISLVPEIGEALRQMKALPGCLMSRMSGSGATIFGIFENCRAAGVAAKKLKTLNPHWWVKPTLLR
jgi:4-diphosphocytidyl-2-C-methyl-D-erythritol kinase